MILADLAIVALGLLFIWVLGGLPLRLSGLALALAGAVVVVTSRSEMRALWVDAPVRTAAPKHMFPSGWRPRLSVCF